MSQTRRPTLEDVAALAGVGRGTASRVINGAERVSTRAREAVEAAIVELGYVPNQAARSLVLRRTDAVALVIAESEERVFGEPFFAGVVRGVGTELASRRQQLVLFFAPADRDVNLVDYLTRQHVDGVLLLSLHDDADLPLQLRARGVPTVVGGRVDRVGGGWVDNDNEAGARLAVEHLVARGRTRIAAITGPADLEASRRRLDAYRTALAAAGLEHGDDLVEAGDFGLESGAAAAVALLARRPDLDAIFCGSDLMAAGALRALREAGRDVPGDVAIVGFDDSPVATSTDPELTSVRQSPEEMGRAMVDLLLGGDEDAHVVLPTTLVVRASS